MNLLTKLDFDKLDERLLNITSQPIMNNPRKQHFVPQVYLKNFSIKKDKIWETLAFDKKNDRSYFTDIKNVAMEKDFYTVKSLEDTYYWEHFYASSVEPLMKLTFEKLIHKCNSIFTANYDEVLNDELLKNLAIIIIMQMQRTPRARKYHYEISKKIFPSVIYNIRHDFKKLLSSQQLQSLNNFRLTEDILRELTIPSINDLERIEKFANILLEKTWIIYRLSDFTSNAFMTSDHPVCMYNTIKKSVDLHDNGIGRNDSIIHYPISSQLLISIIDPNIGHMYHRKMVIIDTDAEQSFINELNKLQYNQSIQHIFTRPFNNSIPGYY